VTATGSSTVTATDSSTVTAYGSSTVTATDSSTVTATDSSTVRAYGSSTVRAYDSSTVTATDSSTVTATPYVAVHQHSENATIEGGVVIKVPELSDLETWLTYYGIEVTGTGKNRKAWVYKAVESGYISQHRTVYKPGSKPEAADWDGKPTCGGGLHFSPRPEMATSYCMSATNWLRCPVLVSEMVVVTEMGDCDKVKARRVVAPGCQEVTEHGDPVGGAS